MKATSYEPGGTRVQDDHCDTLTTVTAVTHPSNRGKKPPMLISRYVERCDRLPDLKTATTVTDYPTTVTRHQSGSVTVVLPVAERYWQRLNMSKNKIRSVWLTVERAAELMNCSTRTVWRYIKRNRIEVHKHQVEQDGYKVTKTFLLTEPSLYIQEMADCQVRNLVPAGFIEITLRVDGKDLNSALIYKYSEEENNEHL
ncbi:MAG: helix-turn-helix domain-containing protein [Candidatus Cloacimonetes bacterium]|nr:helix-turn-helix domain-containing protein [Candidatus Cloacimonadota bacterium]